MSEGRGNFLQNMAPNAKRSFFVTAAFAAVGAVLYLFAVEPCGASLAKEQRNLSEMQDRQTRMAGDLRGADTVAKRLQEVEERMKPYADALLAPTLGSYSVRAQGLVDPLAVGAGLKDTAYADEPFRALPVPAGALPKQLHARAAIRMTAKGSYQEAISFLLRLERDMPLVSVQTMRISALASPRDQSVEFVLEWPAKGGTTTKPANAKGGAGK